MGSAKWEYASVSQGTWDRIVSDCGVGANPCVIRPMECVMEREGVCVCRVGPG